MDWFRLYNRVLDDPKVQRLQPALFREKLLSALAGEDNEFSPHIKPGFDRPHAKEWARLRREVFERDDFTCQYCGARGGRLECDHVIPVSRGGKHATSNLVTACFSCNRSKRAQTVDEWLQ